jgi:segregation and condensation protein A
MASQDEYTFHLTDLFEGPLDLLLHLVKEQEVEIQDVRLAEVVDAYMVHIKHLDRLDIEVAGDYLVVAATLLAIKSRSLLPREEVALDDDLLDPEDELIQRLIEYRRFKGASDDLEERWRRRQLEFFRGFKNELADHTPERELDLGELTAWDLLATYSRLMRETLQDRPHRIASDARPLRWFVQHLGGLVSRRGRATLRELVLDLDDGSLTREGVVGSFCALLELVKIGLIAIEQADQGGDIELVWSSDGDTDLEELIRVSRFMDEEDERSDEILGLATTESEGAAGANGAPPGPAQEAGAAIGDESGEQLEYEPFENEVDGDTGPGRGDRPTY